MSPNHALALASGLTLFSASLPAKTVNHWNFDEGAPREYFSENPVDCVSGDGCSMFGFDSNVGPMYSVEGATLTGKGLCLDTGGGGRDAFTTAAWFNSWSPCQWTIEATVVLESVTGFCTVIGRDGSKSGGGLSDFYLQKNANANGGKGAWRVDFSTVSGQRVTIDSPSAPMAGVFYRLAVTCDGRIVRFFINDLSGKEGFLEMGSVALTGATAADNALAASGGNWTFGRGWVNGGFVDHINGRIDDIRFSDTALPVGEFIGGK